MRTLLTMILLAAVVPDRPDLTPKVAPPPTLPQIFGDWRYYASGPNATPAPANPDYVFRITPTETTWIQNGQPQPTNGLSAKITIDPTKTPIPIDFVQLNSGAKMRGILRLEGDRLVLAWSIGENRPTDLIGAGNVHWFARVGR